MAEIGKYIYGIINSAPHFFIGGGANGTYPISYQDISAVVSDSEIVDYDYILKDTLARLLVRHQEVIERIMGLGYAIIPLRLGTFALNEDEVRDILSKGYSIIKEVLNKTFDKIEIDVAVTWSDFNYVLKEIGEEEKIKEFKQLLLNKKEGVTVDDQMKIGVMVKKTLDEKREKYANKIQVSLSEVSEDIRVHELMDDKMVCNIAFLINKTKQKDFDKKVQDLNNEFAEKLNFRCVGPLPPYSFYTLEVKKMEFEEIDWARKKLGLLNDFTTKDEIKKAHRKQALSFHPDKNPNTPGMEKEFDEVTKAYKIFVDYFKACEQAGQRSSFKEEEFKKSLILVKLRQ
ncbi:hypothetical protein AUJ66_06820 [Candidatus Desantisbacteria bacterium CG1_02_38_46]|uniref:J domain-containing protein n=1 Tax=Candidatus Desantisbacteria bacterium CG1_02_38_46 TaxID=1817893 RepID=A0A1J4SDU7_9BACT|nr:MAG: hypothetical protein AUJ66_06820 [Candidatus Desantisbacteria bacterium CG1_02_38_46]